MSITLTIAQGNAVGKAIMQDARFTPELKKVVMFGLSKPQPNGTYIYTPNSDLLNGIDTWFDRLFIEAV